jgi:hypothetical protein
MRSAKQFLAILICVLMCLPPVAAQDGQSQAKISSDLTIVIERQQVRFTSHKPIEEMRLQVFNQAGEAVFDSGPVTVNQINWPLQNTNGESLTSGLYAYALSIKAMGAAEARVRRGHFIVDRAKERDNTDKLWVTSQNDNGVGAELTLARDENATVAGTLLSGERAIERRAENSERVANDREVATTTTPQTATNNVAPNTIGQIAKFTGANNELGDSVITEAGGNIGIGVSPRAGIKLEVNGAAIVTPGGNGGLIQFGTPNFETGMTIAGSSRADVRFDGSTLKLVAGPAGGPPGSANGIAINTAGKVGIGTTSFLSSRMTIEGQDAMTLRGIQPFLTLQDSSQIGTGANEHRIQSANGELGFFQEIPTQLGFSFQPRLVIKDNGNVQIGSGASSIAASRVNAVVASNSPDAGIAIAQNSGVNVLLQASGAGGYIGTTSNHPLVLRSNDLDRVVVAPNGNLGVGTGTPATKLHVESAGIVQTTIRSTDERAILVLDSNPAGLAGRYVWTLESGVGGTAGVFGIYDRNANKERLKIFPTGLVSVNSLEIRGGSDFSENFDISDTTTNGEATQLKPGLVVSINPSQPGKLLLSARAYDRRVAGIISGAGDIKPGLVMSQEDSVADGRHPVALSGRVYVWADASRGAIKPGDLLTTSPTPGHAMKVTNPARAHGAIIGKVMTGLKNGKGLVLVLVTLQ